MSLLGTAAKLLASLDLDTKPFEAGTRRVDGSLGKLDGKFGRVNTRAIALGTAVGVGMERLAAKGIDVLFDSIRSGEEGLRVLQDTQAQTAAVIESTGGKAGVTAQQIRDMAEAQESLTTVDDKTVQAGENLLLTFTGIGKDVFPQATKAMVDMAVAMNGGNAEGIDLSSTAVQIGKALNDPIKGVTALRKVGVQLTDQQEKQIKKFVKQGDIMSAQKIILGELTTEFGKAGEAAGTSGAAGVRRLSDAVEDTQIALASGLAPALDRIRGKIAKALEDPQTQAAVKHLGEWLGDAAESGLKFAEGIPWGQVTEGLKSAAGFAGGLIKAFANMPPQVQGTLLALAGLNKLSGGAVTGIVSELGKGLIKGVLGMTAGVVNAKAGVVNVSGGAGAGTGGTGGAGGGGGAAGAIGLGIAGAVTVQGVQDAGTLLGGFGAVQNAKTAQDALTALKETAANTLLLPPEVRTIFDAVTTWGQNQVDALEKPITTIDKSPDARDERNKQTQKLESMDTRLEAIKERAAITASVGEKQKAQLAALNDRMRETKAAQVSGSDRITRAVNNIPPPKTTVNVHTTTKVSVTANSITRTMITSGSWSAANVGAFNKVSTIPT